MAATSQFPIGPRQQRILAAIVEEHIQTAEPVGSKSLKDHNQLGVSTATIRNDMVALERAGYISQPHTSAGRVPGQSAYRFYVDHVLALDAPVSREWAWVVGELRRTRRDAESVLRATTRLLSELTQQPALASAPVETGPTITSIGLRPVSANSVRVAFTTSDGQRHQLLWRVSEPLTVQQIRQIEELLTQRLQGSEASGLFDFTAASLHGALPDPSPVNELVNQLREEFEAGPQPVYVDGMVHILQQPEFAERTRLTPIMAMLDEDTLLRRLLNSAPHGVDVLVAIGTENSLRSLSECSLVAKCYSAGAGRTGTIGVLGPMRMPYRQVIAAVCNVAQRVGQLLNDQQQEE